MKECIFKWKPTVPRHIFPSSSNEKQQKVQLQWWLLVLPCHSSSCLCSYNNLLTPEGHQTNAEMTTETPIGRMSQSVLECGLYTATWKCVSLSPTQTAWPKQVQFSCALYSLFKVNITVKYIRKANILSAAEETLMGAWGFTFSTWMERDFVFLTGHFSVRRQDSTNWMSRFCSNTDLNGPQIKQQQIALSH